jgi:hypothetical protein
MVLAVKGKSTAFTKRVRMIIATPALPPKSIRRRTRRL